MKIHDREIRNRPHIKIPVLEILASSETLKLLINDLREAGITISETELKEAFDSSDNIVSIGGSRFYFIIDSNDKESSIIVKFYEYDQDFHHEILKEIINCAKKRNLRILTDNLDVCDDNLVKDKHLFYCN